MASAELLACQGLCVGRAGTPVVRGVDLHLGAGQIVTILGGSGSGKSTLLATLAGLLRPLAGSLRLLGYDPYALAGARQRELLGRAGMLHQHDALLGSLSVLDNVVLGLRELTNLPEPVIERAGRARLALVDVLEIEERLPSQVSGGQSKRAALARATIFDPPILFCDEPTSALDPLAAAHVDRVLLRLRDTFNMGIVAVTHDPASVQAISDRVLVLGGGKVDASGTVAQVRRAVPGFFERGSSEPSGGTRSPARAP